MSAECNPSGDVCPQKNFFTHYGNDVVSIGATDMPALGQRPSLMVTRGTESVKVASFASVALAYEFTDALGLLLGFERDDKNE